MELFSPGHLIPLLIIVAVLFFGWKQLPDMAKSVGRSLRVFKTEMKGLGDDDKARSAHDAEAESAAAIESPAPAPTEAAAPAPAPTAGTPAVNAPDPADAAAAAPAPARPEASRPSAE